MAKVRASVLRHTADANVAIQTDNCDLMVSSHGGGKQGMQHYMPNKPITIQRETVVLYML